MKMIYVTRSKIFMASEVVEEHELATGEKVSVEKELRFYAAAENPPRVIEVPDWITNTLTYKVGIRDKSIVDMTPAIPVAAASLAAGDDDKGKKPQGPKPPEGLTQGQGNKAPDGGKPADPGQGKPPADQGTK